MTYIINRIFYAQFFNTGILIVLVNGNMTEHQPMIFTKYINGDYYDYYPPWYPDVGAKIVTTMIINAFIPYVGLVVTFI
jgi:hypothetical protein